MEWHKTLRLSDREVAILSHALRTINVEGMFSDETMYDPFEPRSDKTIALELERIRKRLKTL